MRKEQETKIIKHGRNLKTIFNLQNDPIELCKQLRRWERKLNQSAVDWCNGAINSEDWEKISDHGLVNVNAILKNETGRIPVFINSDPRGYALKIRDEYTRDNQLVIDRDWGGYGIIAPEIG